MATEHNLPTIFIITFLIPTVILARFFLIRRLHEYLASSVDPVALGSGDKTTHNPVGDVGVLTGAHGDLRVGLPWQALFARDPGPRGEYRLNQNAEAACVFLGPGGRCRIHAKFGHDAKPLACRLYPFVLVPAGKRWRVGLRFSCPSVAVSLIRSMSFLRVSAMVWMPKAGE